MTKTMKDKVKKCFKKNKMAFALVIAQCLEKTYNGKGKFDGFYTQYWTGKSKIAKYRRAYIQDPDNDTKSFVEYILGEEVFKKMQGVDGIGHITIYQWMLLVLSQMLYETITNKEDFSSNHDEGFELLKQLNYKKVQTFFREIVEAFIVRNCQ